MLAQQQVNSSQRERGNGTAVRPGAVLQESDHQRNTEVQATEEHLIFWQGDEIPV